MVKAEQYIFDNSAQDAFYEKIGSMHDEYVNHMIMSGVSVKKTKLETVDMVKSPRSSQAYCERVIGGLLNIKPRVIVKLTEDKKTKIECIFTKINDEEHINHLFMIQNVMDWPAIGKFSCQIWYLGDTSVKQVKDHWA